jgi:hypothetical protein
VFCSDVEIITKGEKEKGTGREGGKEGGRKRGSGKEEGRKE